MIQQIDVQLYISNHHLVLDTCMLLTNWTQRLMKQDSIFIKSAT